MLSSNQSSGTYSSSSLSTLKTESDSLDLIDNILSSFETQTNKNDNLNQLHVTLGDETHYLTNTTIHEEPDNSTPINSPQLNKEIQLISELYESGLLTQTQEQPSYISPILTNRTTKTQKAKLHKNVTNTLFMNNLKSKLNFEAEVPEHVKTVSNDVFKTPTGISMSKIKRENDELNKMESKQENPIKTDSDQKLNGFQTASGHSIKINPNSIAKAQKIIKLNEDSEAQPDIVVEQKPEFKGFQTASGNKIEMNANAHKLLKLDNNDNDNSLGFQTTSGYSIENKAQSLLKRDKTDEIYAKNDAEKANSMNFIGFQTASGNSIKINSNAIFKAQSILKLDDEGDASPKYSDLAENKFSMGFQTASGNSIKINPTAVAKAQNLIKLDEDGEIQPVIPPTSEFKGFQTASGNSIKINPNSITKAQKIVKYDEENDVKLDNTNQSSMNQMLEFKGFQKASGGSIKFNADAIAKAQKLIKLEDEEENEKQQLQFNGFQTAGGNSIKVDPNFLHKAQIMLKLEESNSTSLNTSDIVTKTSDNPIKAADLNKRMSLDNSKHFKKPKFTVKAQPKIYIDPSEIVDNKEIESNDANKENKEIIKKQHYVMPEDTMIPYNLYINNENRSLKYLKLTDVTYLKPNNLIKPIFKLFLNGEILNENQANLNDEFLMKRHVALDSLKERLLNKTESKRRISVLLEQKNNSKNMKIKLSSLKINPIRISNDQRISDDFFRQYKFNIFDYYKSDYLNEYGCVKSMDGGVLICDDGSCIGPNEFFNCLLDSHGVNKKLVERSWFDNHYKWIIWKLYMYQKKYSCAFDSIILTPENVVSQLKYRYDVEIDNAKRPCIRKITEKDDTTMCRTIILFVSKILTKNKDKMLLIELCDGWYPIKAQCDLELTKLFETSKIIIGDKLAIFGAELNHSALQDGYPPLETPSDFYIKLTINSVRKAKWYAKLGFLKPQRPICIPLFTIKPIGYVGAVSGIVERIYPILFMEKRNDGSYSCHNEKQEQFFSEKHDLECAKYAESVLNEINTKYSKQKNVDLMQKNFEVENKIRSFNNKRHITPILKLRLIGTHEKDVQTKTTCLLTIWQNATEYSSSLTEGSIFQILNLQASAPKTKYESDSAICLSTTRQTVFKEVKSNTLNNKQNYKPRKAYEYIQIYKNQFEINEIDTCGFVIYLTSNSYQDIVYLSNNHKTCSILCIWFPKNTNLLGFKDLLKVGELVACFNLKCTYKKELNKYPSLLATNFSLFTQKLNRYKFMQTSYTDLENALKQLDNKIELCENLAMEIIASSATSNKTTMNRSFNPTAAIIPKPVSSNTSLNVQLLIPKNSSVKAPGLSSRRSTNYLNTCVKQNNSTVKRTSTEMNITYPLLNDSANVSSMYSQDTSFSSQDLREISDNELLLNNSAAKRTKY